MKSLKPKTPMERLLFLFAFILIPIFSIILGLQKSIFYENLTYIGNQKEFRLYFQLWGVILSLDYFISFYYLTKKTNVTKPHFVLFAGVLTFLSITSFFLPYQPTQYPQLSNLHVYTSLASSVFTIVLLTYYVHLFQFVDVEYYQRCSKIIHSYLIISAILLLGLGDISGILELFMAIFISIFLYYMICSYNVHTTLS